MVIFPYNRRMTPMTLRNTRMRRLYMSRRMMYRCRANIPMSMTYILHTLSLSRSHIPEMMVMMTTSNRVHLIIEMRVDNCLSHCWSYTSVVNALSLYWCYTSTMMGLLMMGLDIYGYTFTMGIELDGLS